MGDKRVSADWVEAPSALAEKYARVRGATMSLTQGLTPEDQLIQSMPDVSPTKWHLAHTTWFFETFLLTPHLPGYEVFDADFSYLFNSYYEGVGDRHPRAQRGLVSRPELSRVLDYRAHVDEAVVRLIAADTAAIGDLVELGLQHEQQHQELVLMDIKHVFSVNPQRPAHFPGAPPARPDAGVIRWLEVEAGLYEIGHDGKGFAFDNEGPRHKVWLDGFRIANRLTTCGDYLSFIEDGGYERAEFWLSDGWAAARAEGWSAPLYWERNAAGWRYFTLHGLRPLDPNEPVTHLSYYEAGAFAAWSGRRLPTEAEWEIAATIGLAQIDRETWQWTGSAYLPYPRYRKPPGAIGEYNGKFMSGQMVLRGGAAITPKGHSRMTYRNFFPPAARWAYSGVRLADDA